MKDSLKRKSLIPRFQTDFVLGWNYGAYVELVAQTGTLDIYKASKSYDQPDEFDLHAFEGDHNCESYRRLKYGSRFPVMPPSVAKVYDKEVERWSKDKWIYDADLVPQGITQDERYEWMRKGENRHFAKAVDEALREVGDTLHLDGGVYTLTAFRTVQLSHVDSEGRKTVHGYWFRDAHTTALAMQIEQTLA